jgi:hypothetical protein
MDMALESEETPWLTGVQVRSAVEAGGPLFRMWIVLKYSNRQLLNGSVP